MKKTIICLLLIFLQCFMFLPNSISKAAAESKQELNLTAKSALLVDYDSGTVIFEKNADERLPIASMTKLATLAVIFDYIDKGIVKENDIVRVSSTAAAVGGSSAYLDSSAEYRVTDLIKSVIVASANDSSVALAEHVAGGEEVFVLKMNAFAKGLGLQNTNFVNCTGLPEKNHYSTANDMAKIYKSVCNNEIYKKYSKIWIDDFMHPSGRKTELVNTNRLIRTFDGIEGGKTGFTNAARFCLTASAKRGNMRLIGVVIGVDDSKTRFAEMSKLLSYGFANFQSKLLINHEVPVTIQKFKRAKNPVEIYPEKDVSMFLNKTDETKFTTDFQINDLNAPISAGDVVGKMFVFDENNMVVNEVSLVTKQNVVAVGFKESLKKLVESW